MYCHPGAELYGSDRMAVETVRALREHGHDVRVVIPEDGPLVAAFSDAGAEVTIASTPVLRKEHLTPVGLLRLAFAALRSVPRQIGVARRFGATTIWANTLTQPTWLFLGRVLGLEVVCHVREAENDRPAIVKSALVVPLRFASSVIANSEATRDFLLSVRGAPRASRVRVVYNGKDWSPYFRSEPRVVEGELNVIVVGRLNPRKGQDTAIRALSIARSRGVACRLTLAGDVFPGYEWYRAELEELASELGVIDFVSFRGFLDDVSAVLESADVVVVPSRIEPFGTVAAEAMAAMRPVIVASTEGLREIVNSSEIGRTFLPEDAPQLAAEIARIQEHPEAALRMARAGYESVLKRFSRSSYSRQINEVLEVTGGRS